jgi:hypothetical protein
MQSDGERAASLSFCAAPRALFHGPSFRYEAGDEGAPEPAWSLMQFGEPRVGYDICRNASVHNSCCANAQADTVLRQLELLAVSCL